jgi:FKBP-type peptidyl-prolyl cis-trans isomerase 2
MGITPNVFAEDLNGNDIQGIIEIVDSNNLRINFNTPVAGKAYLS